MTQEKDLVLAVKELKTEVIQLRSILNMLLNMMMDSELSDEIEYFDFNLNREDYNKMYN